MSADHRATALAEKVGRAMLAQDNASRALGMALEEIAPGRARMRMTVRDDMINGHDLCIAGESAKFGMPEVIRGSYGAVATSTLFHSGIPVKKAFYIQLTGRNLTAAEAERIGLVSEVVPDDQLMTSVEQLAKELGSRNAVTLESAKIAAYMQKDVDFLTALRTDDLVSHRMRYYTNPLNDVEGYLHSQKGGGTTKYVKPEDRKKQ